MNKEILYKMLLNSPTHKYALLNEIYAIRDKNLETEDYIIAVNGFISIDSLLNDYNLINEKQQLISWLEYKIRECFDRREELAENLGYGDEYGFGLDVIKLTSKLQTYQEVLDFVKGNEKND